MAESLKIVPMVLRQKSQVAKAGGKKFVLPKVKPIYFPNVLIIGYYRKILDVINLMTSLVNEKLIPQLPNILKQRSDSIDARVDGYVDETSRIISGIQILFAQKYNRPSLSKVVEGEAKDIEQRQRKDLEKSLFSILGIQMPFSDPGLSDSISNFTIQNVELISSIPSRYFQQVEQIILREIQAGTVGQIEKKIVGLINLEGKKAKNRAKLIARDQSSKFYNDLNRTRQKNVGIDKYRWETAGDERVRPTHRANDGKIFSWDSPPATGHPGYEINCRCVGVPALEGIVED